MLQKKEQQVMQIQIEDNKFVEEQKEGIKFETVNNEQMNQEAIQKNNIQTVRKMEKMSFIEKWKLTSKAMNEFDSYEQVQKEQRISSLSKGQRRLIMNKVKKKDEAKRAAFLKEANTHKGIVYNTSPEETIRLSYLEQLKSMWVTQIHKQDKEEEKRLNEVKKRHDMSGEERRMRASKNKIKNNASEEDKTQDLENLIHNMRLDMIHAQEYKPDERLKDMRGAFIQFKVLFDKRDEELGRQIFHLGKKRDNADHQWPENLEVPTESRAELKEKLEDFLEMNCILKSLITNSGIQYEVDRMNLRAMEKARQRLVEDNEFQPSAYTQELIRRMDVKVNDERKRVEDIYNDLRMPGGKHVEKKIKSMNALFEQLGNKVKEIQERRKSLEGLQGEELAKEQEKVKAFEKGIEEEARNMIKAFRF